MARISPVHGSITTATPPVGAVLRDADGELALRRSCCSTLSMVSSMDAPADGGQLDAAERVLLRVGDDHHLAVGAANHRVVAPLDAAEPDVVDADVSRASAPASSRFG